MKSAVKAKIEVLMKYFNFVSREWVDVINDNQFFYLGKYYLVYEQVQAEKYYKRAICLPKTLFKKQVLITLYFIDKVQYEDKIYYVYAQ